MTKDQWLRLMIPPYGAWRHGWGATLAAVALTLLGYVPGLAVSGYYLIVETQQSPDRSRLFVHL